MVRSTAALASLLLLSWAGASSGCRRQDRGQRLQDGCTASDVVADDSHLYLACGPRIERIPWSGGVAQRVVEDAERPLHLALWGGQIYWTTRLPPLAIKRAPKAGGPPTVVKRWGPGTGGERGPSLSVDASGIYTSDSQRIALDGSAVQPLPGAQAGVATITTIDDTDLYWATEAVYEPGTVGKLPKGGGAPVVLARDRHLTAQSITVAGGHVYYCVLPLIEKTGQTGGLFRVPKTGGTPERLYEDCGAHLVVLPDAACWSQRSGYHSKLASSQSGRVACVPLPAGKTTHQEATLFDGQFAAGPVVHGSWVYWLGEPRGESAGVGVYRAPLPRSGR